MTRLFVSEETSIPYETKTLREDAHAAHKKAAKLLRGGLYSDEEGLI